MAATPFDSTVPNPSFLFDIYNDGQAARNSPAPSLPGGPCNFVDLAPGANGAKCGCRRFWSRQSPTAAFPGHPSADQQVWCMCAHHACFHDDVQATTAPAAPALETIAGQENEKPRDGREPLSPVQDLASFQMPSSLGGAALDFATLNFASFASNQMATANVPEPGKPAPAPDNSMPDTLSWGNYVQSEAGHTMLPPIPSQCLLPSQSASTTSSSQMRYLRPFAGKGLDTLSSVPPTQAGNPTNNTNLGGIVSVDAAGKSHAVHMPSLSPLPETEAATPRAHTTQELLDRLAGDSPGGVSRETFQQLSETVSGHEQRLDKLENASFSVAGHDDCHDKYDQTDLRVTELESRVEEVEKRLNDDNNSLATSRRTTTRDDDATISVVSVSTNATAMMSGHAEMYSQLQALQAQVNRLQASSLPSYSKPWEVEVVFLPYALKGIWFEYHAFNTQGQSGQRASNTDDWTQQPNTHSRATPDPQSPFVSEWAGQISDWLLPRACAPGRMIDQRLRSRGLIKTVSVRGADARSVHLAIGHAFETVLRAMPSAPGPITQRSPYASDPRLTSFLALQSPWIPLRKLHKDSRLHFLSPPEMLTPALWDAAFLMSSVVMKSSGLQRLYITQPDSYLQGRLDSGRHDMSSGWTWQKLRELSRVYPDSQSSNDSGDVPEADALEKCWMWNDKLDDDPSVELSMHSAQAQQPPLHISRTSDGSSQQYFTVKQSPIITSSPVALRGQSPSILKDRGAPRPPHIRTTSMPPMVPVTLSPSGPGKRRVSSHVMVNQSNALYDRRSSPFAASRPSPRLPTAAMTVSAMSKQRRQGTRSPSLRPRNTPRWSSRSFSRSPSVVPMVPSGGVGEDARGERRTTPFYYATPYSNAPLDQMQQQVRQRTYSVMTDDYGDGDMDFDDEEHGSSTDPYDDNDMADHAGQPIEIYRDTADSVDIDIDVYENEDDELDAVDTDSGEQHSQRRLPYVGPQSSQDAQHAQLPEDEPWPGIEDNMSDGENMNPLDVDVDVGGSDVSSQPSEYPSTQRAWGLGDEHEMEEADGAMGFKIHEDEGDVRGQGGVSQRQ